MKGKKKQATKIKEPLQADGKSKKLKPMVRTTILVDLVALSIVQILANNGMLSEEFAEIVTVLGFFVMMGALGVQFNQISFKYLLIGDNMRQLKENWAKPKTKKSEKMKQDSTPETDKVEKET